MNESYVECLVAKKPSSGMKALKVFLIVPGGNLFPA